MSLYIAAGCVFGLQAPCVLTWHLRKRDFVSLPVAKKRVCSQTGSGTLKHVFEHQRHSCNDQMCLLCESMKWCCVTDNSVNAEKPPHTMCFRRRLMINKLFFAREKKTTNVSTSHPQLMVQGALPSLTTADPAQNLPHQQGIVCSTAHTLGILTVALSVCYFQSACPTRVECSRDVN